MVELLPSILSADFAHLADQVAAAERGGGTVIHVDIMDGHFVPNITIGPPVVKSLRKATSLPLDCHLMIENANDFIPAFADAGANWVSVHYEACTHLHRTLQLIAHHGMKPGVVLNPATPRRSPCGNPAHGPPRADHERQSRLRRPGIHPIQPEKDPPVWRNCAGSWGWHLESKWTAAWLTIPWRRSSKQERSCWWPETPSSAQAARSRMRGNCWLRPARQPANDPAGRQRVRF